MDFDVSDRFVDLLTRYEELSQRLCAATTRDSERWSDLSAAARSLMMESLICSFGDLVNADSLRTINNDDFTFSVIAEAVVATVLGREPLPILSLADDATPQRAA